MPDEEFVTKAECYKTHAQITADFGTIKKALVGDDLRGGLVKDVADIKGTLKNNPDRNNGRGLGKKQQAIIYSTAITTCGLVVMKLIEVFAH